jgi:hypothetical protein
MFASAHPPTSTRPPASTRPPKSAHPPASSITKNKHAEAERIRIRNWWALRDAGKPDEAQRLYAANKGASFGIGGGSRRRRSSHRKRKSYRKSKRVRHTRRKQTRRHRHRHSRYRR